MGKRDPRVDAYIERSADFAKPILNELRRAVHAACPGAEEDMKWSFPHFMYKGMLCSMAAFKQHAAFGFWKGSLVIGDASRNSEAMGHLGRITSVADLPPRETLAGYIRTAAALNNNGVKVARPARKTPRRAARVPADFAAALGKNRKAGAAFEQFPPSHKREYIEWIAGAKTAETRARRLSTAIQWIAEGKSHNWRYERKGSSSTRI